MATDRRFKLIGQGLPGSTDFKVSDLSDGEMLHWDATAGKWTTGTLTVNSVGDVIIEQTVAATAAYLRLIDGDGGQFRLYKETVSNDTILYNTDPAGRFVMYGRTTADALATLLVLNPDGALTGYYTGARAFATSADGITVYDTSGATTILRLSNSAAAENAKLEAHAVNGLYLSSSMHGLPVVLEGEDTGGTMRTLLNSDPDGALTGYYAGTQVFNTHQYGINLYDSNSSGVIAALQFFSNAGSQLAAIFTNTDFFIRSNSHGADVYLQGENTGGTVTTLFSGDPDGASNLFYAGTVKVSTASDGLVLNSTGDAVITLNADTGNTDEAANPWIEWTQDGAVVSCQIGISGNTNVLPDGSALTGVHNNSFVISATYSGSYIDFVAGGTFQGYFHPTTGGLVLGAPTGAAKGVGTLNATAVYDDNTLLTCMPVEEALGRSSGRQEWDAIVGRKHPMIDQYEQDKADGWDGTRRGWLALMEARGSVPGLPNKAQLAAQHEKFVAELPHDPTLPDAAPPTQLSDNRMGVGETASRMWLALDYMAVALRDALNKIDELESRLPDQRTTRNG